VGEYVNFRHNGVSLVAVPSFITAAPEIREQYCNGMGPAGKGWLVPDTIYLLDCGIIGDIHDWMYTFGADEGVSKTDADEIFRQNLETYIRAKSNWFTRPLRLRRARTYYLAVSALGAKHYRQR